MTLQVPAVIDVASTDAAVIRQLAQLLALGQQGVYLDAALKVTTPSGMVSRIAAGKALVANTQNATLGGAYSVTNDANIDQTHAAADATNPRNDLVGIKVEDSFYSGSNNQATAVIVTGTPAATPADPTPPANWLPLARVRVNAGASSLGTITDLRPRIDAVPYHARAWRNAALVIANSTVTTIVYDTESEDPNSNYDTATGVYTVPAKGYYDVRARGSYTTTSTTRALIAVYVNGAEAARGSDLGGVATSNTMSVYVSEIVPLSAGDTVTIRTQQISAGNSTMETGSSFLNWFSIRYLGN